MNNNEIKLISKDGKAVVSSRVVAEDFGKQHKNVLRSIQELTVSISSPLDFFIESSYVDTKGETRKEYLLTRDGFSLLVMGFTGSQALQWKLKYIEAFNQMEEQLKNIAVQSPKAFVDSLKLTEYSISKYLPNFLTWKNVDEVLPLLIERVGNSVDKGDIKIGILGTTINVAKSIRDAYPNSAEKEIMTRYIEQAQEKYDRILIASKAGITKSNNELIKKLEDKEKELKKAETKRLKTFSRKSLLRAYEEENIIHDMVEDYIKDVVDDELYKIFVDNLETIVSEIVKKSGKSYSDVHMDIYKSMGIRNKGSFKTYTEYIFYNQLEFRCLDKASDILNRY